MGNYLYHSVNPIEKVVLREVMKTYLVPITVVYAIISVSSVYLILYTLCGTCQPFIIFL